MFELLIVSLNFSLVLIILIFEINRGIHFLILITNYNSLLLNAFILLLNIIDFIYSIIGIISKRLVNSKKYFGKKKKKRVFISNTEMLSAFDFFH